MQLHTVGEILTVCFTLIFVASGSPISEAVDEGFTSDALHQAHATAPKPPALPDAPTSLRDHHHPLPPAAVPGLLRDFDSNHHRIHNFVSDISSLESHFPRQNGRPRIGNYRRKKRSANDIIQRFNSIPHVDLSSSKRHKRETFEGEFLPQEIHSYYGEGIPNYQNYDDIFKYLNADDIARLQHSADIARIPSASTLARPSTQFPQSPLRNLSPRHRAQLDHLLGNLDILEQLTFLTALQADPKKAQLAHFRNGIRSPASRFAPQPKLFSDEPALQYEKSRVNTAPMGWTDMHPMGYDGYGVVRKRFESAAEAAAPKRSSFREQRFQDDSDYQEELVPLAAMLGSDVDPEERIRRTAM